MKLIQRLNKYYFYCFFIPAFFFAVNPDFAESNPTDSASSFQFKWSNDFEYQTDYYYTNGFSFQLVSPYANIEIVNKFFLPSKKTDKVLYNFTLLQDIFTPKNKFSIPAQLNGDRPFAAYILAGVKKTSFSGNLNIKLQSEIQIGILGPAALGEEVQNGIHRMLPTSAEVEGWENQISNSLMINYTASIQKYFYIKNWLDVYSKASVKLGLPYTFGNFNVGANIGILEKSPNEFTLFAKQGTVLSLNLFLGGNIVGYNATLQGGIFSKSVYTIRDINRFVGEAGIGLTFIFKNAMLRYQQIFTTPEFRGALHHSWGYLLIEIKL